MKPFILPPRAITEIHIPFPEWEGKLKNYPESFKILFREWAKTQDWYWIPVLIKPAVHGRHNGKNIPINTLGRWIFGVPGFAGNCVFNGFIKPPVAWFPIEIIRIIQECPSLFGEFGEKILLERTMEVLE